MSDEHTIPVAAPIDTNSAGRGGTMAMQSVFKLICLDTNSSGTGFLHKSGRLLTAEHVVRGSKQPLVRMPNGAVIPATIVAQDEQHDLALLQPAHRLSEHPLPISSANGIAIGAQVSTWGFPSGYNGNYPMLSVGYIAGMSGSNTRSGVVNQWVVNAAFNSGNSGGPLLHIETGSVIGVVSSKLAPISRQSQSALAALQNQQSGFMYTATLPDGTTKQVSEGQIVASLLKELRQQVQLVIGMAVLRDDVATFLKSNNLDP